MGGSRYRELGPELLPAPVQGLVECAWRVVTPWGATSAEQRVLPDGCMDLLLLDGRVVVAGPDTTAHMAARTPGSVTAGLRFRPGHLPALLGVPADALRGERVPVDEVVRLSRQSTAPDRTSAGRDVLGITVEMRSTVVGGPAHDADAHLDASALPGLTVLLATAAALRRDAERVRRPLPEPLPGDALRALTAGTPAAELADRLGVTTRTLHRRCLATLGYGPSVARRVLRFRTAAGLLYTGVSPAEVAARAGYADQPHLSREVRALAGVSPGRLAPPR